MQSVSVVVTSIEQEGRIMEQLWFSRGLVTPLILYGRVIFSRSSRTLLWSVFYRAQVSSTFVSWCLLTPD